MYKAIEGIYENGNLTLTEAPPTTKKSKVVVLFMDDEPEPSPKKRIAGGLKYLGGSLPADFNEPLDDLKEYME